jgi:NADH-quinone oxidoreductase subunit N
MNAFPAALGASLLPVLLLAGLAAVCAVIGMIRPGQRPDLYRWIAVIALLGAVTSSAFTLAATTKAPGGVAIAVWGGGLLVDRFSLYVTVMVCAFALITCLSADVYLRRIPTRAPAFFALVLLVTAATSALAAERGMATLFVTLEVVIVGISGLHALVKAEERAAEGAWKFLVEAAVGSALLLYGLAILYGVAGSGDLRVAGAAVSRAPAAATLGLALVLIGLTVPLGVAPLRQWLNRAGEALPATVAGFVITMGVTAGAVAWLRFGVSGLGASVGPWTALTAVLAAIALGYAALAALSEGRVTRLVGAVASSQAALLLLALISTGPGASAHPAQGATAFLFALGVFGLAVLAAFAMLSILETARLPDALPEYRGLGRRSPVAAALLAAALAALVGAPPAAGFIARVLLWESSVDAGYGWLVVVAVAAVAVVAVPVTRLIAGMYAEPEREAPFTMAASPVLVRVVAGAVSVAGFLATLVAQPLLLLAHGAAGSLH